jgi:metallo-beta-lactamase class B
MKTHLGLLALAVAGTVVALGGRDLRAQPVTEAMVQGHVAAATKAAGADLQPLLALCKPAPADRPKGDDHALEALINKPAPAPGRAFDNLYYVGAAWVSAWAIDTSQGIILIDALNTGKEAAQLIEGGLRKVGLDPARIKIIIVTHGHGDHYGGAAYLAGKYKARVVMSDLDWKMMETKLEFDTPLWDKPPQRDMAVKDGDTVKLGDTTVTLYLTPGHTLGTISPVFDVKSGGQAHRVIEWGGTGFNFGADFGRLDAYIAATARMRELARQQNIDVLISNHSGFDEAPAKLAKLREAPGGPNPFILGVPAVERSLTVMNECAQAQRDRFRIMGLK